MPVPPKADPEKACEMCGEPLTRKRFASGRLEDRTVFLKRRFCGQSCANTKVDLTRSGYAWRARKYMRTACEECGTVERLHVHHKNRDWSDNDPANLATLCASCHLKLHWREDRAQRLAVNRWWRGGSTKRRSDAGKAS